MGKPSGVHISQQQHFQADFGTVTRSSAIFYYRKDPDIRTTLSFLNYWKLKRDLDVSVQVSTRTLGGKLVLRETLNFDNGWVINYSPFEPEDEFEGSVELEVFCDTDMVIPYAAAMTVYESRDGISMVHSYARAYSQREIDEGRAITHGEEACWTLRDSADTYSFAVFHNGATPQPNQDVGLRVLNHCGEALETTFKLPELQPHQTIFVQPSNYLPRIADFLENRPGNASLSFKVEGCFTRMLVGNGKKDDSDLQVTHSNFNYAVHETDVIRTTPNEAYMDAPSPSGCGREVTVYPERTPGHYVMATSAGDAVPLPDGESVDWPLTDEKTRLLRFTREDGPLPSRLVTGLRVCKHPERIPAECSLGVSHALRPTKRMWWGLCSAEPDRFSSIIVNALEPVFGSREPSEPVYLKLYAPNRTDCLETTLTNLSGFEHGVPVEELFPGAREFLGGAFGWFTLYSDYPGFLVYSTLENAAGSICLEHGF